MTEQQARDKTKYFGEGVRAEIACYWGTGDWRITVNRETSVSFYGIDELKRRIFEMWNNYKPEKDFSLELWKPGSIDRHDEPLRFPISGIAKTCISEIWKAVVFIRSQEGPLLEWVEIPEGSVLADFNQVVS